MDFLEYPFGSTPLDPDESQGLIPLHISTQQQLNEWELANILEAQEKILRIKPAHDEILTLHFCQKLHKNMFSTTWKWAGELRQSNKNIGVDWLKISVETRLLLDDVKYQIAHDSYPINPLIS
jgi:fido (protein-threonine AMPylation protein)